jgi:hypothetical protein
MRLSVKNGFRYLLSGIIVLFILVVMIPAQTFSAESPGLKVDGASLVTEVSPGESLTHQIIVSLSPQDSAADISLEVYPLGQSPDGSYAASSENHQYSALSYITLDKSSLRLEPGDSRKVTASIRIPAEGGTGGRYALINLRTEPVGQGTVGVIKSVNIPVYLTYKNTDLVHTGRISETGTGEITSGKSIDIITLFKNTGNHHFKIKSEVIISDSSGNTREVLYTSASRASVIPEVVRQLKATYLPAAELTAGIYFYRSKVMLEDGTLLDEAQGSFEIKDTYSPPPAPVSENIDPTIGGELRTEDGSISILLDRGSLIGQTRLSLIIFSSDQLPAPPSGCKLSSTCFRVDGLNGLLAKPAEIRVKYSAKDLEQAGCTTARLVLARWDTLKSEWIILKTAQDENNLTLSAETEQFGIITVMIKPATSEDDWCRLWIVLAAAAVVSAVFIFSKRKN